MSQKQTNDAVDVKINYLQQDITDVKQDVKYIKEEFLTRREFTEAFVPIRNGFFGLIMLVITGFVSAVLNFFIKKP